MPLSTVVSMPCARKAWVLTVRSASFCVDRSPGSAGVKLGNRLVSRELAPNRFDLLAEFIVKVAGAEDQPLAEEGLLHAALVGSRGGSGQGTDVQLLGD